MIFFQIIVSYWKIHSLIVVFIEIFLILLMSSWMFSMTILEMFHTINPVFQTIFIFVIDTNTTALRIFNEFWWFKIESSTQFSLLTSCYGFIAFVVSIFFSRLRIFWVLFFLLIVLFLPLFI